jgi:hypothetical protein
MTVKNLAALITIIIIIMHTFGHFCEDFWRHFMLPLRLGDWLATRSN